MLADLAVPCINHTDRTGMILLISTVAARRRGMITTVGVRVMIPHIRTALAPIIRMIGFGRIETVTRATDGRSPTHEPMTEGDTATRRITQIERRLRDGAKTRGGVVVHNSIDCRAAAAVAVAYVTTAMALVSMLDGHVHARRRDTQLQAWRQVLP